MIRFLDTVTFTKNTFTDVVEVLNLGGEPWHFSSTDLSQAHTKVAQLTHGLAHVVVVPSPVEVKVEAHQPLLVDDFLGARLNGCHVDSVVGEDTQSLVENTGLVLES